MAVAQEADASGQALAKEAARLKPEVHLLVALCHVGSVGCMDLADAAPDVQVFNPAFDITPGELITAFITERGVIRPEPDFETGLALMCMMSGGLHEIGIEGFSGPAEYRPMPDQPAEQPAQTSENAGEDG